MLSLKTDICPSIACGCARIIKLVREYSGFILTFVTLCFCLLYYMQTLYFISDTDLFMNASNAEPFSIPFCSRARSMS